MSQRHGLSLIESRMMVDQRHLQMKPSCFFSFSFPCKSPDSQWLEEWTTHPFSHTDILVLTSLCHWCLWPMFLDSEAMSAQGFHAAVLGWWHPSSGHGQDALKNGQSDMLSMAGGVGECMQESLAKPLLPTPPCSPLSLLLYSQREVFSADFWSLYIYLFLSWQSWEQDLLL